MKSFCVASKLLLISGFVVSWHSQIAAQENTPQQEKPAEAVETGPTSVTPVATPRVNSNLSTSGATSLNRSTNFVVSGSVRTRLENWRWFETPGFKDNYSFLGALLRVGATQNLPKRDTQIELAVPLLWGLPTNAVAPAPQGVLGLGGNYRAASGGQDASLFPRQAWLRFKNLGNPANSLRLGRFEFWDGAETTPKNPTLAAVKRDRIAHRLLGNFGFSHVGRSYDGLHFVHNSAQQNFTVMAARPTGGVFQLNGLGQVKDVDLAYGAWSQSSGRADKRLFALFYRDGRQAPLSVKVDNRPAPARSADRENIGILTLGGHYASTFKAGSGEGDFLLWGALQSGDWGTLRHRASAVAIEAGYQPANMKWKPWLRLGYNRGSGDGNAADGRHGAFFQVLPTPRIYARTPFYNMMNNEDLFAEIVLRPNPKLTVRSDVHRLRLANAGDLWYQGGGAFQDNSFGYAGRPSGGSRSLGTLFDISLDYSLNAQTSLNFYMGYVRGGRVVSSIYPTGANAHFAYLEMTRRF